MLTGSPPFYSKDRNTMFRNILEVIKIKKTSYYLIYY